MKTIIFVGLFVIFFSQALLAQRTIVGTWVAYRVEAGQYAEISSREASQMLGRKIFMEADHVKLFDDSCVVAEYKVRTMNADEYLDYGYRTKAATVGLKNENVEIVEIYCKANGTKKSEDCALLVVDVNTLIYHWRGHFFWMKRERGSKNAD